MSVSGIRHKSEYENRGVATSLNLGISPYVVTLMDRIVLPATSSFILEFIYFFHGMSYY